MKNIENIMNIFDPCNTFEYVLLRRTTYELKKFFRGVFRPMIYFLRFKIYDFYFDLEKSERFELLNFGNFWKPF